MKSAGKYLKAKDNFLDTNVRNDQLITDLNVKLANINHYFESTTILKNSFFLARCSAYIQFALKLIWMLHNAVKFSYKNMD